MRGPRTSVLGFAIAALLALPLLQVADAQARRTPSPPHEQSGRPAPHAQAPRPAPRPLPPPPRELPRRNEIPPSRLVGPRTYHFPPLDVHLGFYYHPYFGFYYGPYYGPFYPYAGPYPWPDRYMSGAIRTKVTPRETEVYVNGYFAGIVDDFDGVFQRLYLPAGEYTVTLRLAGYASFSRDVLVRRGDTLDISHTMLRLPAGQLDTPVPSVSAVPEVLPEPPGPGAAQPASPPKSATLLVDLACSRLQRSARDARR